MAAAHLGEIPPYTGEKKWESPPMGHFGAKLTCHAQNRIERLRLDPKVRCARKNQPICPPPYPLPRNSHRSTQLMENSHTVSHLGEILPSAVKRRANSENSPQWDTSELR